MNSPIPFPIGLPGHWQNAQCVTIPDAYLKNWLLNTGSLTERLQSYSRQFSLTLLGQRSLESEATVPDILRKTSPAGWQVREVILHGDGQPWVFAHSLIPEALCQRDLAGLGNKPLGQRIFNDPGFTRSAFEITQLTTNEQVFQYLNVKARHPLWGRRSIFSHSGLRMMVAEIFLPAAPAYAHMQVT